MEDTQKTPAQDNIQKNTEQKAQTPSSAPTQIEPKPAQPTPQQQKQPAEAFQSKQAPPEQPYHAVQTAREGPTEQQQSTQSTTSHTNQQHEVIFVGSKPIMNYVTALVMQFTSKDAKEVRILSRGKFITKAVDIAEIVRNRFLEGKVTLGDIKIGSEHFQNAEGKQVSVSSIEITLKK